MKKLWLCRDVQESGMYVIFEGSLKPILVDGEWEYTSKIKGKLVIPFESERFHKLFKNIRLRKGQITEIKGLMVQL